MSTSSVSTTTVANGLPAPQVQPNSPPGAPKEGDGKLESLLQRINSLTAQYQTEPGQPAAGGRPLGPATAVTAPKPVVAAAQESPDAAGSFVPREPSTFAEAGITESAVEELTLKYLLARGEDTGHGVADQIKLPYLMLEPLLRQMKQDQLVVYRGTTTVGDYVYQLTDMGRERARRHSAKCTYFGSAPVELDEYIESVCAQSLQHQRPSEPALREAFRDLLINPRMLDRLGPAINSGRGMFLFGSPGNGKTSIAERVTRCFGQFIWIPRAIGVDGEIVRLYDPSHHELAMNSKSEGLLTTEKYDRRWVRVRRPTIVVGGELTMDNLELTLNTATGVSEAPIQLKSNCGTLVIDDFGRQRMSTDELLNRWIVPLEKRYDFLNLPSGKKIQVPFDQLIIFSTNLEPKDLVDDAFLRRIPYKIEVTDPSEDEFRELFRMMCPLLGFEYSAESVDYLIETYYRNTTRPFRCCHPRDLLLQVRNYCSYKRQPVQLTPSAMDFAVENYFAAV